MIRSRGDPSTPFIAGLYWLLAGDAPKVCHPQ